jgi:PAS domain S-box-containing protein
MMIHRHFFITLAAVMAVIVIVFASVSVSAGDSPNRISIAYCKDSVPFHFSDENGQPAGIIIDLWRLWSEKTGIAIDFHAANWDATLTMVGSGAANAHAGLFYNKERDKFLDYGAALTKTDTHYFSHVALPPIKKIDGLAAYRVGVIEGDHVERHLKERLPEGAVIPFSDYDAIMNALEEGTLRVFAADTPTGLFHLDKSGLLSEFTFVSEKPLYQNDWFVAVQEGSQALIEKINQGMARITDEEKRNINRRWIGSGDEGGKALVISIDRAYAPLTFVNALGRPSGFFVDMWRAWAQKTGRQIQFRPTGWTETLEGLRTGEVDIHSGLSFSKGRAEWIDFSTQIYKTYTRVYHRAGDIQPTTIGQYGRHVIGTWFDTSQEIEFRKTYPNVSVRSFGTNKELIDALLKGEIKAIVQEELFMEADIDRLGLRGDITARPERLFPSTVHAGVLNGNSELLEQINKGFAAIPREKLADLENNWIHNSEDHFYKSDTVSIVLSPEEKSWLENHPVIRVGIMDKWPPMNFVDEQGNPQGIGVDFINVLNKSLNGVLIIVPRPFKESFDLVKSRKLDALMDITPKKEREPFFNFTTPYLTIPHVLVGRKDGPYFNSEKDLKGKTIALERGFYNVKYFRKNFPEITVKEYGSTSEALGAVSSGEAEAYAGNRAVVTYLIEKELITNLSAQGRMEKPPVILTIGVRKDWPLLADLLDRAFESVPQGEMRGINRKWMGELKSMEAVVKLTPKEAVWIKRHPVIRVVMDPDWAPVEFVDEGGNYHGISVDYLERLEELLGVRFEVAKGLAWQDALTAAENGELDIFPSMARTPERSARYNLTLPYLSMPINIFGADNVTYVDSLSSLEGKRIAVVDGYAAHEWLQEKHPGIKLVPVKSIPAALKMLAAGETYAFVGNVVTTSYYISKLGLNQIRVVGETPYKNDQSMAVRQDWPVLAGILQKALEAIPQDERYTIFNRWVSVKYEHGFDYSLLWKVLVPAFLVVLLFFYWNRRLRREVSQRMQAEADLKLDEERLESLLKLGQIKAVDEEQLIEYALEECVRLTHSQIGYLHFVHPDQKTLSLHTWSKSTLKYCKAEKNSHYPIAEAGIWADCVREKGPVVHNDYPTHPNRKDLPEGHVPLNRHLSIPVVDGDKIVMVTGVGNKENPYIDSDVRQLTLFMHSMWGILKEKRAEEKLQFTQFAVDRASDAAFWMGPDARFVYVNDAACRNLGYSKEELLAMTVHDIDPNLPKEIWREHWNEIKTQGSMTFESLHQTKDGNDFHVEITSNFMVFGDKAFISAFARDVTERRNAEEAIKESEERIKTILDSINTGIIVIDPEDRTIVDANPIAERMIGLPRKEIIGSLCHKFICPREMNDCPIIDHGQEVDNADRILLDAEGREIPILKTVVKVILGGKPHLVESFVDLTERKQAEEKLQRNLEELERFNEVTIDREEMMIELKNEINQLMKQMGKEKKYKIVD